MQNIVNYFNSLFGYIFGMRTVTRPYLELYTFDNTRIYLSSVIDSSFIDGSFSLLNFIGNFFREPSLILSCFIWVWFAVFCVNLLLIFPYRWIRSVLRKCKG